MSSSMEHMAEILTRAQIVRGTGIPDTPRAPVCSICGGAGYLRYDVPVDDPRFGELVVCECTKQELAQKRQELLLEKSMLADLQHFTFDSFVLKIRDGTPPPNSPDAAYHVAR